MRIKKRWVRTIGCITSISILAFACFQTPGHAAQGPSHKALRAAPSSFLADVKPIIDKYCITCHAGSQASAGLNLSSFTTPDSVLNDIDHWSKIVDRLSKMQMPPQGLPQPTEVQRKRAVSWIENALNSQCKLADPGRVTLRRLNRVEYDNTIRDLTGVNFHASEDFPSDDVGYGFDDIGDVLSISPLLMEKYLTAAEHIARKVIPLPSYDKIHVDLSRMSTSKATAENEDGYREFFTNGEATTKLDVPPGGTFKVKTLAYGPRVSKTRGIDGWKETDRVRRPCG
jgi:hypothetical protein